MKKLERLPSGEALRGLRSIEVLEQVVTPEARRVLQKLAQGVPWSRLTGEAKASLVRLGELKAD